MDIGVCNNCVYWCKDKPEKNGEYGVCQRYPPVIVGFEARQPITWKFTLCGEFKERDKYEN